mgnify:CR=1 FL=1
MTQALAQARKALVTAIVAMKIASALPNVSDEYDFDPAIAECSAALAAIDAALEGGAVPKVRALEWTDGGPGYIGGPTFVCETMVGRYLIEQYGEWCVYFDRQLQSKGHPMPEAARAAAQAHFDSQVLSALDLPSPPTGA